jgi:hypothetical protein
MIRADWALGLAALGAIVCLVTGDLEGAGVCALGFLTVVGYIFFRIGVERFEDWRRWRTPRPRRRP